MPLTLRIGDMCLEALEIMRYGREGCEHGRVASVTWEDIEVAVRSAWARDTAPGVPGGTPGAERGK
jgi:hypothetical protein